MDICIHVHIDKYPHPLLQLARWHLANPAERRDDSYGFVVKLIVSVYLCGDESNCKTKTYTPPVPQTISRVCDDYPAPQRP